MRAIEAPTPGSGGAFAPRGRSKFDAYNALPAKAGLAGNSSGPVLPLLATSETWPAGVTFTIAFLSLAATYRSPLAANVMPSAPKSSGLVTKRSTTCTPPSGLSVIRSIAPEPVLAE